MKITICIGSSCHLKGSRMIVEDLQKLVKDNNLTDKIELAGQFCMGNCQKGVCVTVDGAFAAYMITFSIRTGRGI